MTMATTPHLPATVDASGLARIPEPYREAYIDYDDAGQRYEKNDRIVAYVTSQLTEIERLSADIAATKATSDAEIARLRKGICCKLFGNSVRRTPPARSGGARCSKAAISIAR